MGPYIVHGHFMYGNTFCMPGLVPRPPWYNITCHHRAPSYRHIPPQRLIADDADTGVGYAEPEGYDTGDGDCTNVVRYSNMPNITAITAKRISTVRIKLWGPTEEEDKVIDLEIGKRYAIVYLVSGGFATADGYLEYIDSSISDSCTKYTGVYSEDILESYIGLDCSTTGKSDKRKIYIASIRSIEELDEDEEWQDEPEPELDTVDLNKRLDVFLNMLEGGIEFVDDILGIKDRDTFNSLPPNAKLDILLSHCIKPHTPINNPFEPMNPAPNNPSPPHPNNKLNGIGFKPIAPLEDDNGNAILPVGPTLNPGPINNPFEPMNPAPPPIHKPDNKLNGIGFKPIAPLEDDNGNTILPVGPTLNPGPVINPFNPAPPPIHKPDNTLKGVGFKPIAPLEDDNGNIITPDTDNPPPPPKHGNVNTIKIKPIAPLEDNNGKPIIPVYPPLEPGPVVDDRPMYPPEPYHSNEPIPSRGMPPMVDTKAEAVTNNLLAQLDIIIYDLKTIAKATKVKVDVSKTDREYSILLDLDFDARLSTILYKLLKYNDDVGKILTYDDKDIKRLNFKQQDMITDKLVIILLYLNKLQS